MQSTPTQKSTPQPQQKPVRQQKQDKTSTLENRVTLVMQQLRELTRRIRTLEEQMSLTRKKLDVFNQNMLNTFQKDKEMIERQRTEIRQFQKDILELQDMMRKLVKDINSFAKREELLKLEKYVDFWHPIKFVTYDGLEKLVKKKVNEKIEDINMKLQIEQYVKKELKKAIIKFLIELKNGKIKIPKEAFVEDLVDNKLNVNIMKNENNNSKKDHKTREINKNTKNNDKSKSNNNLKESSQDQSSEVVDLITGEPID